MENILAYQNAKLNYSKSGNGDRNMILFHGFGQNNNAFKFIAASLTDEYTLYSIDLFFHGRSVWSDGEKPLAKAYWKEILTKFCNENNITSFSLVGFSLGCRFVLASIEAFPNRIENVFLIAPDGIKTSFWYSLATQHGFCRDIFKSFTHHPARFQFLANILSGLQLMDKSLIRFAKHQMETEDKRKKVYYAWVVFRYLSFDLKEFARLANNYNIGFTFIAGTKDPVIKVKSLRLFQKLLKNSKIELIETGHLGILKHERLIELLQVPSTNK